MVGLIGVLMTLGFMVAGVGDDLGAGTVGAGMQGLDLAGAGIILGHGMLVGIIGVGVPDGITGAGITGFTAALIDMHTIVADVVPCSITMT